ncbi:MAG: prepilin peptidase [Solirubrobacteraceae bacterium]
MARQPSGQAAGSAGIGQSMPLRLTGAVVLLALWFAALNVHRTLDPRGLALVLVPVLVWVTITDLEARRIPNSTTLPASVAALLVGVAHPQGLPAQVIYGLATGGFLLFFALVSRGGLGMGDVKLGVVLGLFLGRFVVVALAVGLLASALFSIGVLIRRGLAAGRRTAIPLGPFLALGGVVAVLAGAALLPGT